MPFSMSKPLRSTAYRIALVYALGFAAAMLIVGGVIVMTSHIAFTHQQEAQILEDFGALVGEYRREGHPGLDFAIGERERRHTDNELLYAVYSPNGRRIAGRLRTVRPQAGWNDLRFQDSGEGSDIARAWAGALKDGSLLVVAADQSAVERVDRRLGTIVLVAFGGILALSLIGAMILGAYLRKRLSTISDAAESIMAGDITQRVPEGANGDEFDALSHVLNRMLDQNAVLVDNLQQVSSDVAHDLRTPLARLRTHIEECLAEIPEGDFGRQRGQLEFALEQIDEVLALFSAILRISKIEAGKGQASFRLFDFSELVREITESYVFAIEEQGRMLTANIESNVKVQGDAELLAQALINLLDNAQIHTPVGTHIQVQLEKSNDGTLLWVNDNGPGIPKQAHRTIFRRFARLNPGRGTPGHGLGLSLVAAIVATHGGEVMIGDNGPGLCIGFRLSHV